MGEDGCDVCFVRVVMEVNRRRALVELAQG